MTMHAMLINVHITERKKKKKKKQFRVLRKNIEQKKMCNKRK
jgi:hypothetical protein